MDINNMSADDYLNLYYFKKADTGKPIFQDYNNNFKPTIEDINRYNKRLKKIRLAWDKDKSMVHKFVRLSDKPKEVKADNDFDYCAEIGHKFELWIEKELKGFGVDLGMYYDNRQFKGENALGLEIKHDSKLQETGNVYIEYEALSKDESKFIKGGILKEDNSEYWLVGTEKEYYIFYKQDLLDTYKILCANRWMTIEKDGIAFAGRRTSKGIIISRKRCREMMIADNLVEFIVKTGIIDGDFFQK